MTVNVRPLVDKIDSAAWLNAIRENMSPEYYSRIPEATQANLKDTINNLWSWNAGRNQVADAFVNQLAAVVFRDRSWTNPLGIFKMGMLPEGDAIEDVMVGLVQAQDYDSDRNELEEEIFGYKPIEVKSFFHKRNRKDRYKVSLDLVNLKTALLGNQLGSYAQQVMSAPLTSSQLDEFLMMTRLFKEFDDAGAYFDVNVPDVSDQGSDSADSRFLLRRLREYGDTLPFISRFYNPAGMPVSARKDELVLINTPQSNAAMDVEALAGAFNMSKADFGARNITIPVQYLGIPGVQSILTTDKFFVVADNLIETTSQFNPATLRTNYWQHVWQIISANPFAPLIMFNSERPSTVISETATPVTDIGAFTIKDKAGNTSTTTVTRGVLYDVNVSAVTTPTGGANDALILSVTGDVALSRFTYITNNGDLYIGPDEQANTLTITATAVDNAYTESVTRTVTGNLIYPWPNPEVLTDVDSDALEEVFPEAPDFTANVITIPTQRGVQYKDGATNLVNGAEITVVVGTPKTITAVARTGFELGSGATATWTFTAS
jgi:hypothetical protein